MKAVDAAVQKIDSWQKRHRFPAFAYAVIKKYGEDESGKQAALLTYYGFLSLFPLLLVLTTVASQFLGNHPELHKEIIKSVASYFPVLGSQLSQHISSIHKNGLALIVGIVFTLYGARGVADAFRNSVQNIWKVPKDQRPGFPKTVLNSLFIILVGGVGFLLASIITGLAATAGHGLAFRLLSIAVDLFILFWLFTFLLNSCLPKHISVKDTSSGALSAAIGVIVLQALGGYLLRLQLKNLDALYSYFAIALGLLFWIYLQSQLLHYAITISAVRSQKLWPRSLAGE